MARRNKRNKRNQTIYFNAITLEVIKDIMEHGGTNNFFYDSVRGFIEQLIHGYIWRALKRDGNLPDDPILNYEQLCELYLSERKKNREN